MRDKTIYSRVVFMSKSIAIVCLWLIAQVVTANPQGAQVVSGNVSVAEQGNYTQVNQSSAKAIVNWQSFNIGAQEHTHFQQPSSSAIILNRIQGKNSSQIFGKLTANGRVMLINPSGIVFGPNSRVDVAGLIASTADIKDSDFLAGNYYFQQAPGSSGKIVNQGLIKVGDLGVVALLGQGVENSGVIQARLGQVALGSGRSFTLDFYGDQLIQFKVPDSVLAEDKALAGITQSGSIQAAAGRVWLKAKAANDVVDQVINMSGVIEAQAIAEKNGEIILLAEQGKATVAGKLDVSGQNSGERGGEVQVLGEQVELIAQAEIDATGDTGGGQVFIGGDYRGSSTEKLFSAQLLPNAQTSYLSADSLINASAINQGNGGVIIVWADELTQFYGKLIARGGAVSGDGGFIETSAKSLVFPYLLDNVPDAGADNGAAGEWLIDPFNLTISTNACFAITPALCASSPTYSPSATGANLQISFLVTALGVQNVSVTNGLLGGELGNITVRDPISWSSDFSLTLTATNNLTINASISNAGAGDLLFNAGEDIIVAGQMDNVGSGNMTFSADNDLNLNASISNAGAGDIRLFATGGTIHLGGATDISIHARSGSVLFSSAQGIEIRQDADVRARSLGRTVGEINKGDPSSGSTLNITSENVQIDHSVGASRPIDSLIINASSGQVDLENVSTSGPITVTGNNINIDLNGDAYISSNAVSSAITFSGSVDLDFTGSAVNITTGAGQNVSFSSTIDSGSGVAKDLTIDAGTIGSSSIVTLGGNIGGTGPLNSLRIDSHTTRLTGSVTEINTVGDINLGNTLGSLNNNVSFITTGASTVTLNTMAHPTHTLTINTPAATVNALEMVGSYPAMTYSLNATSGNIASTTGLANIEFNNINTIKNSQSTGEFTVNYTSAGVNTVTLQNSNDVSYHNKLSRTNDPLEVYFMNPTTSLLINGSTGVDVITLEKLSNGFNVPLTVNAGSGNDIINVQAANGSQLNTISGGAGSDVINVSSNAPSNTGTLSNIGATLTIDGGNGADSLFISNKGSSLGQVGTLNSHLLTGLGMVGSISFTNMESFNLDLGSGSDTFTITGNASANPTTTVNLNEGDDHIEVFFDSGNSVPGPYPGGSLILNGGSGNNTLKLFHAYDIFTSVLYKSNFIELIGSEYRIYFSNLLFYNFVIPVLYPPFSAFYDLLPGFWGIDGIVTLDLYGPIDNLVCVYTAGGGYICSLWENTIPKKKDKRLVQSGVPSHKIGSKT